MDKLYVMRLLAAPYTRTPCEGVRRMTVWLRPQGDPVHPTRVARLLRSMGLETIDATPRMRQPHPAHRVYPYVLRGVPSTRVNQVWRTAITAVRLQGGVVYVVAVMAWFSRYGLSWAVSITRDVGGCWEALEPALGVATPPIFNSDPGAQFTSLECTGR